jgi:hypothetical protein
MVRIYPEGRTWSVHIHNKNFKAFDSANHPKNLSWTGSSVRFSAFLARRDDDATSKLIGGTTKSRSAEKWAIEFVALLPKW